jgi:predicted metal-dependent hydrolase
MSSLGRGAAGTAPGTQPIQMPLWTEREAVGAWNVRISRRARRLSMRVFPGGRVEVVVPPGTGLPAIERFVARHRDWAERRAREFELLVPGGSQRRPDRIEIPLTGQQWTVEYQVARRASILDRGEGVLRVCAANDTPRAATPALLRWLAGVAAHELRQRLDETARETGIDYVQMHLRRQRTRSRSCSAKGTLILNMCLIF